MANPQIRTFDTLVVSSADASRFGIRQAFEHMCQLPDWRDL